MEHLYRAARQIADQGRGPDTHLMHVTGNELSALGRLHPDGQLPRNPSTGLPEAGFLDNILPTIAGLGVSLLTGGAAAPLWGALASGATSTAMTGDLGKGIMSGLLSYGAGSALNSLAGQGADAALGAGAASGTGTGTGSLAGQTFAQSVAPATAPTSQIASNLANVADMGIGQKLSLAGDALSKDPMGALKNTFIDSATKTSIPLAIGAAGTFGAQEPMQVPKEPTSAELQRRYPEQQPTPRTLVAPPEDYMPGVDAPWDYLRFSGGGSTKSKKAEETEKALAHLDRLIGDAYDKRDNQESQIPVEKVMNILSGSYTGPQRYTGAADAARKWEDTAGRYLHMQKDLLRGGEGIGFDGRPTGFSSGGGIDGYYAKGGIADPNPAAATKANIVAEAKMALLDHHPKAKEALRRYADTFGEDALKSLTDSLSSMGGRIRGAGGGLDDLIPGTIEGRKEVRLADGEFVVPADVVSHLGDGSSDHGVRKLTEMMDRIRKEKTGTTKQAGHINDKKVLPA